MYVSTFTGDFPAIRQFPRPLLDPFPTGRIRANGQLAGAFADHVQQSLLVLMRQCAFKTTTLAHLQ